MPAKSKLIALAAAVVLVVSVAWLIRQAWPPSPRGLERVWFYDLNTQQLFPAPITETPPIAAPSGPLPDGNPAGVRARVYGCGDCAAVHRVIAYLETYTPAQKRQLEQWHERNERLGPPPDSQGFVPDPDFLGVLTGQAVLIKRPADTDWVARGSAAGIALVHESLPRCPGGGSPQECWP